MKDWEKAERRWSKLVAKGARWVGDVGDSELAAAIKGRRVVTLSVSRDGYGGGSVWLDRPESITSARPAPDQYWRNAVVFRVRVSDRDLKVLRGNAWESMPALE